MKLSVLCLMCWTGAVSTFAQPTAPTLAAVGYTAPTTPIPVAAGQVVTLFFRSVPTHPDGSLRLDAAKTVPLPTVLGGLSVHFGQPPVSFPIFAVRQENDCSNAQTDPGCLLTSLRVQVPFNLRPAPEIVLDVDGKASRTFPLTQISDNTHVLTSCDLTWDTTWFSPCHRLAYHGNGTEITEKSPARLGETMVVYLWGLGLTTPSVPAGEPSPAGVVVTQIPGISAVHARFLDEPRTSVTGIPAFYSPEDVGNPGSPIDFLGLTPGQVGLYQLNVAVPRSLAPQTSCGDPIPNETFTIAANAVLRVTTPFGATEEVGFCLQR